MKDALIVKVGSTLPHIARERGDYDAWFLAGMGWPASQARVVDVRRDEALLPAPDAPQAVVVTGSSSMVTDREPWSERTGRWLLEVLRADTPLLAVCYGHQLLVDALGGRVGDNPKGREIGTSDVRLLDAADNDPLFQGFESPLHVPTTHRQSILELPQGLTLLASNPHDAYQAYRAGARAWGIQFHPEFSADIIREYLHARRERLLAEGLDADRLAAQARQTDHGTRLLRRFAALARG